MKRIPFEQITSAAVAAILATASAAGAQTALSTPCSRDDVPAAAREYCYTVAQALESTQPQLGILIAGGNPTIGSASTGGLRLGVIPRVSAGVNLNVVFLELPDILTEQASGTAERLSETVGIPAPAVSGTASVGVFGGFSLLPTVGGVGAIDLLGTVSWLPFSAASVEGFQEETENLAYGAGVRVGILRESFVTPGISVSVIRRQLGTVAYGDVCPGASAGVENGSEEYAFVSGACAGDGDPGEFSVDLGDWSTRAVIGKRLLGFGLLGGVGYDRFTSDVSYGFRAPESSTPGQANYFAGASGMQLDASRWSAFGNASLTLLVATVAVEAGWLQGDEPIEGFPDTSDFDPGSGTFFGSVGVRLAL